MQAVCLVPCCAHRGHGQHCTALQRCKGGMQEPSLADSPEDVADHGLAHGEVGHRHFVVLEVVINGLGGAAGWGGVGGRVCQCACAVCGGVCGAYCTLHVCAGQGTLCLVADVETSCSLRVPCGWPDLQQVPCG